MCRHWAPIHSFILLWWQPLEVGVIRPILTEGGNWGLEEVTCPESHIELVTEPGSDTSLSHHKVHAEASSCGTLFNFSVDKGETLECKLSFSLKVWRAHSVRQKGPGKPFLCLLFPPSPLPTCSRCFLVQALLPSPPPRSLLLGKGLPEFIPILAPVTEKTKFFRTGKYQREEFLSLDGGCP